MNEEIVPMIEARVSVPDVETAQRIARELVSAQVAACVQLLGPITSVYTWKEEVHQATEWLLLIKTVAASFQDVADIVVELHRYDIPEVIAVPVTHTLESYGSWVSANSAGGIDDAVVPETP